MHGEAKEAEWDGGHNDMIVTNIKFLSDLLERGDIHLYNHIFKIEVLTNDTKYQNMKSLDKITARFSSIDVFKYMDIMSSNNKHFPAEIDLIRKDGTFPLPNNSYHNKMKEFVLNDEEQVLVHSTMFNERCHGEEFISEDAFKDIVMNPFKL